MEQLIAHLIGDYLLQHRKMAMWKVRKSSWALLHSVTYLIPFLVIFQPSVAALSVMGVTHFLIDRFSLAKYWLWLNNVEPNDAFIYEDGYSYPVYTGNLFLVYVATDNTFHLIINYLALRFLG